MRTKDYIEMLIKCAELRNVLPLQHRTIHEFAQFTTDVIEGTEKFKKYQFDWLAHDAMYTWIEKFYEYCKEEYKEE